MKTETKLHLLSMVGSLCTINTELFNVAEEYSKSEEHGDDDVMKSLAFAAERILEASSYLNRAIVHSRKSEKHGNTNV